MTELIEPSEEKVEIVALHAKLTFLKTNELAQKRGRHTGSTLGLAASFQIKPGAVKHWLGRTPRPGRHLHKISKSYAEAIEKAYNLQADFFRGSPADIFCKDFASQTAARATTPPRLDGAQPPDECAADLGLRVTDTSEERIIQRLRQMGIESAAGGTGDGVIPVATSKIEFRLNDAADGLVAVLVDPDASNPKSIDRQIFSDISFTGLHERNSSEFPWPLNISVYMGQFLQKGIYVKAGTVRVTFGGSAVTLPIEDRAHPSRDPKVALRLPAPGAEVPIKVTPFGASEKVASWHFAASRTGPIGGLTFVSLVTVVKGMEGDTVTAVLSVRLNQIHDPSDSGVGD